MIIAHNGKTARVDPSAYVAPNAVLCGDVAVGPRARIMFGAQVIAEGGTIAVGAETIVMENAVLRATARHSLAIGENCVVGPNAHLVGCQVDNEVFIATGAAVFHAARLGRGSEVRINAVVHLRTQLPAGETVPIGWVAVGDPAQLFSPDQHHEIWEVQKPLDFPLTVYGINRAEADMIKITRRLSEWLGGHKDDREVG
jgi:carbonic anhydrase/acetyltransferase-like protein (isoleucine patch superfamily)